MDKHSERRTGTTVFGSILDMILYHNNDMGSDAIKKTKTKLINKG